jgi:hypothetical protein
MRNISVIMIACAMGAMWGCSGKHGSYSLEGVFEKLSHARGFSEKRVYFTKATVSAIEDAATQTGISVNDRLFFLPRFDEKTKWEEVSEKVEGDRGLIRLRYTDHPVENMIGLVMEFKMKRENGAWKIDLADEIRAAMKVRRNSTADDYIRLVRKRY